jgi:D-alanyl-D-alanine carboxypeptidase (penicillin-binding protein 5/6)
LLQSNGQQKAVPIASIAKVITALAVLKEKPLQAGQNGPNITITSDDVAIYNNYYRQNGSVIKVTEGEQISQYQALQALLIPSANNIADTLARWAFGSQEAYAAYANQMVKDMGLSQTVVADASGFSPKTLSTANELVQLGLAAMDSPVIAAIVAQQSADLPVAGTVNNVNWLLGSDGVIGIKTGNTVEAGGCFLFAAKRQIESQDVTLVGALTEAPDLNSAIKDARAIIRASDGGFETIKVAIKNQTVGVYKSPWGANTEAMASKDLSVLAWRGSPIQVNTQLNNLKTPAKAGTTVGSMIVTTNQKTAFMPLILNSDIAKPSWTWRLFH